MEKREKGYEGGKEVEREEWKDGERKKRRARTGRWEKGRGSERGWRGGRKEKDRKGR